MPPCRPPSATAGRGAYLLWRRDDDVGWAQLEAGSSRDRLL